MTDFDKNGLIGINLEDRLSTSLKKRLVSARFKNFRVLQESNLVDN